MARAAKALLVAIVLFSGTTLAEERITRFDSTIEIQPDRSLHVTESINVIAQNTNIRHGIYRDFPTVYPHPAWGGLGVRERTGFKLLGVELDGHAVPWKQDTLVNGIRLYIGDPNQTVVPGAHQYRIRYSTPRQISRLGSSDVLQWNVNGQGWMFPADSVSATVQSLNKTPFEYYSAWTGLTGDQNTDVQIRELDDGTVIFASTRPFAAHEGMTISMGLPPGSVEAPQGQFGRLLGDNYKLISGLLLILLLPLYYFKAWQSVGRDPQKGVVVADYHPVRNLSPAAHRFVSENKADDVAFTAALVNMAIKGYLHIEQLDGSSFKLINTVTKDSKPSAAPLTSIETVVHKTLFGAAKQITLDGDYNKTVALAKKRMAKLLKLEWRDAVYRNNRRYSWLGLLVGLVALTLCGLQLANAKLEWAHLLPLAIFVFVGIGITQNKMKLLTLLPAGFFIFGGLKQSAFTLFNSFGMVWLSLFVAGLFILFHYLLKAPTPFGQKILDEIEGFRLYLGTAEQHRLDILHPPEKTPALFEQLLPYAIALGVENQWGEKFSGILERASLEKPAYQPGWYSGRTFRRFSAANIGPTLVSGLAGSIASAATAPSSSGGGFSGGGAGGGGGGGGGW